MKPNVVAALAILAVCDMSGKMERNARSQGRAEIGSRERAANISRGLALPPSPAPGSFLLWPSCMHDI